MKIFKYLYVLTSILFLSCAENQEYGKNSDISFPIPIVSTVTTGVKVGEEITITGDNFSSPNIVSIDGISMKVVSESKTEIKAILPRLFNTSPISVTNSYKRKNTENIAISPVYPTSSEIAVTTWPAKITRGRALIVWGSNMDMIVEITVGSTVLKIDGLKQTPERVAALMPNDLKGTESELRLKTIHGDIIVSPTVLPIVDAPDVYVPVPSIVLLNFEDGNTHFTSGDVTSGVTSQINRDGITAPEGTKFYSLYVTTVPDAWGSYLGSVKIVFDKPIDLIEFTEPHFTFMVNSADNIGNFQAIVTQNGKSAGSNFTTEFTGNKGDNYCLRATNGTWQTVSVNMVKFFKENWWGSNGLTKFDPQGRVDSIELSFKQGNGGTWDGVSYGVDTKYGGTNKQLKINLDKIIISDIKISD